MTDLSELVRDRCAEYIAAGKRPTKAMQEWYELTREHAQPYSSTEGARNAKGDMQFGGKFYALDPTVAEQMLVDYLDRMRRRFPMQNGTVGSPMVSKEEARARAGIAANVAKAQAAQA